MAEETIYKNLKTTIKAIDLENHTVTAIVSHAKDDRDGDEIPPESMKKRIGTYKKNPVVLANHDYNTASHIGKTLSIKPFPDHVEAKIQYFADRKNDDGSPKNPTADWAWELVKEGMAAYSIGFKSHEHEWIKDKDDQGYETTRGRRFKDIELLEISHVVVPANPNALQLAINDKNTPIEEKELCELVLKGFQSGKFKGPKDQPSTDKEDDDFLLPEGKTTGTQTDDGVDGGAPARIESLHKRLTTAETTISRHEALHTKHEADIKCLNEKCDKMLAAQSAQGSVDDADANMDLAQRPGKRYRRLFSDAGDKPDADATGTSKTNKRKSMLAGLKQTLQETQKGIIK